MGKVLSGIEQLPLKVKADGGDDFCQAILTTDLTQKMTCVRVVVGGKEVHIAGAAKGSGMIHPNMATMLGFMTTDAPIESEYLQQLLSRITDTTFNMITVDGDTSTNDMVVVMASGLGRRRSFESGASGLGSVRGRVPVRWRVPRQGDCARRRGRNEADRDDGGRRGERRCGAQDREVDHWL